MARVGSFTRCACAAILLVATVGERLAAQRGVLTATLTGHRTTPTSDTLALQIAVRMTPGWHIGAAKPGVIGVPTTLSWRLPAGWRVQAARWPAPAAVVVERDTVFEYREPFTIETTLVRSGSRSPVEIQAVMSYGICREVCIPGRLVLTYDVR